MIESMKVLNMWTLIPFPITPIELLYLNKLEDGENIELTHTIENLNNNYIFFDNIKILINPKINNINIYYKINNEDYTQYDVSMYDINSPYYFIMRLISNPGFIVLDTPTNLIAKSTNINHIEYIENLNIGVMSSDMTITLNDYDGNTGEVDIPKDIPDPNEIISKKLTVEINDPNYYSNSEYNYSSKVGIYYMVYKEYVEGFDDIDNYKKLPTNSIIQIPRSGAIIRVKLGVLNDTIMSYSNYTQING